MNNQRGNSTLVGILLIFTLSAWSLLYLQKEAALFNQLKSRLRTYMCMKGLNGEVKTHVRWMERLNTAIEVSNAVIVAGIAAPPAIAAAKIAKRTSQAAQQAKHFLYLKNLWGLHRKKCFFDPRAYTTPYKNKITLTRDAIGRAKLRKRKWKQTAFGDQVILRTEVKRNGKWRTKLETESWEIQEGLSLLK